MVGCCCCCSISSGWQEQCEVYWIPAYSGIWLQLALGRNVQASGFIMQDVLAASPITNWLRLT